MRKLKNNLPISIVLILLGFIYLVGIVFQNKAMLFHRFDPIQAEKTYSQSQWQQSQNVAPDRARDEWAMQHKYSGWSDFVSANKDKVDVKKVSDQILASIGKKVVSDSFLYSYAGYKYIGGTNPSLLNPEHPPLAKYLIGYSIRIFGSEHVIGIAIAFAILVLVGVISYQLYGSLFLAGFALLLTSLFPLFTDQIVNGPQLELYQLFFFLIVVHFLLQWIKKKQFILCIPAGIFFGLLLSTKTFLPFFFLFSTWIVLLFWKQWKVIVTTIGVGILVFVATYYRFFMLGGTLRSFLGLQKYIIVFYGNAHIPMFEFAGNYLRLIFTGRWKFWDTARSVSFYQGWNILWPILFLLGLWRMKKVWKKSPLFNLFTYFLILYNLFVFFTPVFPRYLLSLFIPMIILI